MLVWDSSYSVKVKEIDNQHKRLIDYINLLEASTRDADPQKLVTSIFKGLMVYTIDHFTTEEDYFRKFNYEKMEEHMQEHKELIRELNEYFTRFETEKDFDADRFMSFLRDWLIDHIMGSDKDYITCFADNGLT